MKAMLLAAMLLMASGCSDIPRDAAGTLDRVRQTGSLRVGMVSDTDRLPVEAESNLIAQLAHETGSRPAITRGSTEILLPKIEKGELDIVVGRFAPESPWSTRVTFLPAPEHMDAKKGEAASAVAVRNGENGWVTLIYKHTSNLPKAPQ